MLEVCWEHNYSNDMLRLVTDEDSKLYAGTAFLKNKKNKKNSYFCLQRNSAMRMMFVRGIGAAPSHSNGVQYVSFGNRRHMGAGRKKSRTSG